ncbi:hypothetical protein [Halolamina salina]|uniref:Glycoside hydrolase domain protein n=1 Tax=Halolamina salina TaxID=1220023 RepID=A0ABD6B2G6_9EURY
MYGVVTRNEEEVEWSAFDRGFYEVKDVTGRAAEPLPNAVNMVSCFGDTAAGESSPELLPVDDEGNEATREQPYFDWGYVCPTHEGYREGLLETISDCAAVNEDVRLDDVGFPRAEYCRCDRCERLFAESEYEDRFDWRGSVITEFVKEASERIPGRTYLTLYPDPYPGHLFERAGLDLSVLSAYVDEYVVPVYDTHYSTTYWLETIASGFQDLLGWSPETPEAGTPFSIELYAVDVDVDNLIHAAEVAERYGKDTFFGYDASNAQAAIRRKTADEREGVSHG